MPPPALAQHPRNACSRPCPFPAPLRNHTHSHTQTHSHTLMLMQSHVHEHPGSHTHMDTGTHTFTHPHAQALSHALQNEDQMKEMTHLPEFLLLGTFLPRLAPVPAGKDQGDRSVRPDRGLEEGSGGLWGWQPWG